MGRFAGLIGMMFVIGISLSVSGKSTSFIVIRQPAAETSIHKFLRGMRALTTDPWLNGTASFLA